jgi:hypothetical protein
MVSTRRNQVHKRELGIHAWLTHIEETNADNISDVLNQYRKREIATATLATQEKASEQLSQLSQLSLSQTSYLPKKKRQTMLDQAED